MRNKIQFQFQFQFVANFDVNSHRKTMSNCRTHVQVSTMVSHFFRREMTVFLHFFRIENRCKVASTFNDDSLCFSI